MADDTPVTRTETETGLNMLEERLLERLNEQDNRLPQGIEKSETNLLTAFRTWARRSDTRQKATSW